MYVGARTGQMPEKRPSVYSEVDDFAWAHLHALEIQP